MPGYPLNPSGNRPTPAGWTGTVTAPGAPAGGNGPGASQPYSRQEPDEGSWFWGAVHGAEHFADSAYHSAVGLVHDAEDTAIRVAHVAQAIYLADDYAGDAIRDKIGMDIAELKKAFIPGLVMSLGILAITTLAGATVAGILVGALTAGAGAVPAAVAGGELGLDAGFLILDALGIGFLLREVFGGISEVFDLVKSSMAIAWNAGSNPKVPPMTDIDKAAHGLATAVAEMVNLLLQGVLIWILKESAVARAGKLAKGSGSLTDPAALSSRGTQVLRDLSAKPSEVRATLKEGTAELAGLLRKAGQLTRGLADFVETKFEQILKKVTEDAGKKAEELKAKSQGSGGDGGGGGSADEQPTEPRPVPKKEPPLKEPPAKTSPDPIAQRRAANQALRNSSQFQKDLAKADVSQQQLEWMDSEEAPLGFESPEQFQSFKQDLSQALRQDGLDDAEVGMKGTATTFYSENPNKPLGHFWDADPTHPGDYDLNLASDTMAQQMSDAGIGVSPKYGIFRTADMNSEFPALSDFSAKWSAILGRDVNIVGYPAGTVPVRDPTEFILAK